MELTSIKLSYVSELASELGVLFCLETGSLFVALGVLELTV